MLKFLLGMFIGTILGITIMCILQINKGEDL